MHLVLRFTRMPGESYRRRLRSLLLCLCDDRRLSSTELAGALNFRPGWPAVTLT